MDQLLGGQYHSVFKGQGIEFAEVREYQPGDEVRWIDWNVTARTGVPFVKRFDEERQLTVILAVDADDHVLLAEQFRVPLGTPCIELPAGLIGDEDRSGVSKVPGLGDIPLLGRLFSNNRDEKNKTEIVMLITPRIIRNVERPQLQDGEFFAGTDSNASDQPLRLRSAGRVPSTPTPPQPPQPPVVQQPGLPPPETNPPEVQVPPEASISSCEADWSVAPAKKRTTSLVP